MLFTLKSFLHRPILSGYRLQRDVEEDMEEGEESSGGENHNSWTWFIQLLMGDLGISYGLGWRIISDQHKVHIVSLIIV